MVADGPGEALLDEQGMGDQGGAGGGGDAADGGDGGGQDGGDEQPREYAVNTSSGTSAKVAALALARL